MKGVPELRKPKVAAEAARDDYGEKLLPPLSLKWLEEE